MRNRLKIWKTVIDSLENPNDRPNDFQRLVLDCIKRGMPVRDAVRIFGVTQPTIQTWLKKFSDQEPLPDDTYFMNRARQMGAEDEVIAQWFGMKRPDQVAMRLAKITTNE